MKRRRVEYAALVILGVFGCGGPASPLLGEHEGELDGTDAAVDAPAAPPPFAPLHVPPEMLEPGTVGSNAPDLVLSAPTTSIDTTALTIDGATSMFFVKQGNYAILFTKAFSVQGAVKVTGTSPLIVVASDQVTVSALIDVSAVGRTPGPGAAAANPGGGGAGQSVLFSTRASSGGGGAGYGSAGAAGGTNNAVSYPAGAGGLTYGAGPADTLVGGSKGGNGGYSFGTAGAGGAGGGALQISSAISISVSSAGQLKASGGGGAGGGGGFVGGGGGGSGGEFLLEAPQITLSGRLTANGGGGGGGGAGCGGCSTPGLDGQDGGSSGTPAAGGAGGIPQGSPGGAGAVIPFASAKVGGGINSKGGGGGGGVGRIWLRYRAATPPITSGAVVLPPPGTDSSMP